MTQEFHEFSAKNALVLGLGESGLAMAKWLAREGAAPRVADSRESPPKAEALRAALPDAEIVAGAFTDAAFSGVDLIAISPGVPVQTPQVQAAIARGVPVLSEIELFARGVRRYAPRSRVIAITGSNGKTTTTALTAHLLNAAGIPATACGNISPSALDALMAALDAGSPPAAWVLELSSFQLETTHTLDADAAALLNVSEDHLDRYADMDGYARAKARIFAHPDTVRVLNGDDEYSMIFGACAPGLSPDRLGAELLPVLALAMENPRVVTFGLRPPRRAAHYGIDDGAIHLGGERLAGLDELPLTGLHNAANVMAALALCQAIGVTAEKVLPALREFKGLAHRVELIAEIGGVSYYDDSKGTNVGATLAAVRGLGRKLALILGGEGKGQDFSPLKPALAEHARAVALIGRDAPLIARAIDGCGAATRHCADLEDAVRWCASVARPGDAVLLSPACASFDMFRDYAHRAEVFASLVRVLREEAR
ncbi:MAG: UDP-N-acetylmuramoyl-L-alanine--D-glutamate ligase [Candidatus Accumulibacter sp.]|jgi:UDP-N-acetylmuramoylalanine--D-glutamate ligase|nr:UDP-N-acetylmuramoyl-L-alanine--D-glutamate ligase [Accumulibacter sp.]